MTDRIDIDALLAETGWLGRLARRLVASGHDADDLVQETLCSAVENPPAAGRSARGWLRTVLLHRLRDAHRATRARCRREAVRAPAHDEPATADVVGRAELHRDLVDLALALQEPYRRTVLMRFFEGLPPREIARRTGAPVATVNSRLQRGLAMLRGKLAARHGPRWATALGPLLPRRTVASLLVGVSLVKLHSKVLFGVAAVSVALLVWWWPTGSPIDAPDAGAPRERLLAATADDAPQPVEVAPERAPATARPAAEPDGEGETATAAPPLQGRVVDVLGVPIAGVALAPAGGGESWRSGLDGRFTFAAQVHDDRIVARDARWATVLAGSTHIRADKQCQVVVAPRVALAGHVVDERRAPLPGAVVQLHMPRHLGADLDLLLDYSVAVTWRAVCDEGGRFELPDVPAVAAATLSASLGGYLPRVVDMPPASTELLEFVLEPAEGAASIVDGIVLDAFGAAVAGARVGCGLEVSRTDERGAFRVDVSDPRVRRLVAIAEGMQPAVFEPPQHADGEVRWPARVILRLGPPPRTLQGRVVDGGGQPVAGARVWIADPLLVGQDRDTLLAESLLARGEAVFWAYATTSADGAFELGGLLDRAYELRAVDMKTLVATQVAGVQAGRSDVELVLAADTFAELRGRVVARDGTPIAGVGVNLQRPALEVQVPAGTRDTWAGGGVQRTGDDGVFVFENVPKQGVEVFANGDSILFRGRMVEPDVDPLAFDLVVDRRVHLQVEIAPPVDRVDRVKVLDAFGRPMLLRVMRGLSAHTNRSAAVLDGRSEVLSLGEDAAQIVFERGGEEVGRLPARLVVGDVNRVQY